MTSPRPLVVAVLLVALGGVAGCDHGGSASASSAAAISAAPSASPAAAAASPAPSASGSMAGMPGMTATPAAAESGPGAGIRLQALFAQHAVLAADMMRARARRDPDFAQAAEVALTRNTQALGELVGSLFGADAGRSFATLWTGHITQLFAYADAAAAPAAEQGPAKAKARSQLVSLEQQLASLLSGASNGRLKPADAQQGIAMHVDELLGQADAFAAGDYAKADAAYQQGYEHAFTMGGQLATVLLPAADVKTLATPDWQLRQGLTQLLGDHVALVIASMRAASGDPADFTALGSELNSNTKALAGAVGTLYGARGGQGLPVAVGRPRGRPHGLHGRLEEERRSRGRPRPRSDWGSSSPRSPSSSPGPRTPRSAPRRSPTPMRCTTHCSSAR